MCEIPPRSYEPKRGLQSNIEKLDAKIVELPKVGDIMNKVERVERLKEIINDCLQAFENDGPELDDPGTYYSCGTELNRALDELKEILLPEEYYQLEQKYRYTEPKK